MDANFRSAVALAVLVIFTGCAERKRVEPPIAKLDPKATYDKLVLLEVESGISDIRSVSGRANYTISNAEMCVPLDHTRAIGGTRPLISQSAPIRVSNESGSFYISYQSAPFMREDYYGLGECAWGLTGIFLGLHRSVGTQEAGVTRKRLEEGAVRSNCSVARAQPCMGLTALSSGGDEDVFTISFKEIK